MKTVVMIFLLGCVSLFAAELEWASSYKDAVKKAKAENKNIMLLITTKTCRWCRKLESVTLTDERVVTRLHKDYVSVHVTRDEDEYPAHLKASAVPKTYYLDTEGNPLIKGVLGYWSIEDYLSFMDDVDYKLGKKEY